MKISSQILHSCAGMFHKSYYDPENIGKTTPIPKFSKEELIDLMLEAKNAFKDAPMLLKVNSEAIIVGDIHGNLHDLLRIFAQNGYPPKSKYIFLGDYVDRGFYSIEVIYILFSFMLEYPDNVYLLRGNHEFIQTNIRYGFYEQVTKQYDEELFMIINNTFDYMPVACVLNNHFFLVHAGIESNRITRLEDIEKLERPISGCIDNPILLNLMWSDPTENSMMTNSPNKRGLGTYFVHRTVRNFLHSSDLKMIIRGHEVVSGGFKQMFSDRIATVFSSSGYCKNNTASVILIRGRQIIERKTIKPLDNKVEEMSIKYINSKHIHAVSSADCMVTRKFIPIPDKVTTELDWIRIRSFKSPTHNYGYSKKRVYINLVKRIV